VTKYSIRAVLLASLLTWLSFLAACASASRVQTGQLPESDCELMGDNASKLDCYFSEIRGSIHVELISAVRDWARFDSVQAQSFPRRGVKVDVELNERGEVKNVNLVSRSDNLSFNDMIVETIQLAGPFALPKDRNLRKRLLKFRYNVEI